MIADRTTPYTIGFFTAGTNLGYSAFLANLLSNVAKEKNINLINFLGGSLNPNFTFSQYKYQYQYNVAFNFAHTPYLDGIILGSSTLASFLNDNDFFHFYSQFKPLPMVSLGVHIPDLPSTYTDNTSVFNKLVSHLIQAHNRKKIGFVSGPFNNTDAFDRYLGYTSALSENHISFEANYIYEGDFSPASAKNAVKVLLDERKLDLDAIVCANDSMALVVINELKQRHILIPEQIIVTGCDNIPAATYCVPSLTSIEQPLGQMVYTAVDLLLQTIKGKNPHNVMIPSKIVYRESCGCHLMTYSSITSDLAFSPYNQKSICLADDFLRQCTNALSPEIISTIRDFVMHCYYLVTSDINTFEPAQTLVENFFAPLRKYLTSIHLVLNLKSCISSLKTDLLHLSTNTVTLCYIDNVFCHISHELLNYLLDYYSIQIEHLNQNFDFSRQFLATITHNVSNKEQQLQSIIPSLMKNGITSCLIYLYPEGITHNLSDTWKMPDEIYLYMGYVDREIISPDLLPQKIDASEVATYGLKNRSTRYTSCVHPIFFGNEQLGVIVFEMSIENYSLIDHLTVELGCALKLTSTFTTQKQIENKLEVLSQTDELTDLLNRRGFFNLAQNQYNLALTHHQKGILFYADMDGLKIINDHYGHHEGDYAIVAMSQILKKAFSKQDIVGRIGGDEFVILSINQEPSYIERIIQKVDKLCIEFNTYSNKPYPLSISIGSIFFSEDDNDSLEYLLSRADQILYDKKRLKKIQHLAAQEKDHYTLI